MNFSKESTVGEIVAQDYRTASVFKSHNIDFCCKGNRSIGEACEKNKLNADACMTYRVAFEMLREFENDLHLHIHLENNILFPKALEAEKTVVNA